jgi:hypothetical protein
VPTTTQHRISPAFRIGTPPPATTAEPTINPEIIVRPAAVPTTVSQFPTPATVRTSPISTVPAHHLASSPDRPDLRPSLKEIVLACAIVVICYHGCRKPIW